MSPTYLSESDLKNHTDFMSDVFGRVQNELSRNDYSRQEQMEIKEFMNQVNEQTNSLFNPECHEHINILEQTSSTVDKFMQHMAHRVVLYIMLATIITSIDIKKMLYQK